MHAKVHILWPRDKKTACKTALLTNNCSTSGSWQAIFHDQAGGILEEYL